MRQVLENYTEIDASFQKKIFSHLIAGFKSKSLNFTEFIPDAWNIIEPATAFLPNWHIDCIAEHLQAVTNGEIKNLVINMPPRNGKSNFVSKMWPTWSWTKRPGLRWIFISYSQILAETFSKDRRDILESDWYRENWGNVVKLMPDQNQKREFMNTARGTMMATSIGGTLTGKGADIIVIDDGIDPKRAHSKAERESTIRFIKQVVSTRLNDKKTGAIVEISQRTHKQDISGTLLSEGNYFHLNLPAIAPKMTMVYFPISKKQMVREPGDILHSAREDQSVLDSQKVKMLLPGMTQGQAFEAQYQQNPTSDEGGMFRREYWKFHKIPPQIIWKQWTWDTAMEEGETNDYTVGALLCYHGQGVCVERLVRARMQYPELKRTVLSEWEARPGHVLLIEDKVSGKSLAQDLIRSTSLPIKKVQVKGDKVFRASLASPYFASGRVSVREGEVWVPELIEEFAEFPNSEYKDQVDSICQGINEFYLNQQSPAAILVGSGIALPVAPNGNGTNGNGHQASFPDWM